ncbi:MAG UNVERIFIED_CONTAM: sulfatase-like hydrolase/transferase [Rickettsiaceae bacterium]|jgi:glucan phosphoethanolaminetransferase (alkaline phosphatase superfamily)
MVIALVYFLLFNSSILIYKYSYYKAGASLALIELSKESLYIFIMLCLSLLGFSINNMLFKIYSIFLYSTGALVSYYVYAMKILPTKQVVKAFFDVESVEAYELVSIKMIGWVILSIVICLYLLKMLEAQETKNKISKGIICLLFILSIANIITPFYRVFQTYLPINYLNNSYHYFIDRYTSKDKVNIVLENKFSSNAKDDLIAVLVIGESARYENFSLNNYKRDTNPNLTKLTNITSYKCEASANNTYDSVSSLLSRHNRNNIEASHNENSILSLFTHLDFDTIWIGTQSLTKYYRGQSSSIYDEVKMSLIPGGSALYALNSYDEVMLPYFEDAISKNGKKLIVIHMSGSHWNYGARYPEQFAYFKPTCEELSGKKDQTSCSPETLINSYDNSIRYSDYILSQIISKLEDKNSFLIYVSDHGESLGENGIYGHGSEVFTLQQKNIPLISWFSNKYLASKPDVPYFNKDKILSHDNIFHSLLDCADISSNLLDKNLSICNKPIV